MEVIDYQARDWIVEAMLSIQRYCAETYCYCRYLDPGFELANAIERAAGSRSSGSI